MNTGWEKLYGAQKYHYFEDRRSLCDRWTLSLLDRHYLVSDDRMPDDAHRCKVCEQRLVLKRSDKGEKHESKSKCNSYS